MTYYINIAAIDIIYTHLLCFKNKHFEINVGVSLISSLLVFMIFEKDVGRPTVIKRKKNNKKEESGDTLGLRLRCYYYIGISFDCCVVILIVLY